MLYRKLRNILQNKRLSLIPPERARGGLGGWWYILFHPANPSLMPARFASGRTERAGNRRPTATRHCFANRSLACSLAPTAAARERNRPKLKERAIEKLICDTEISRVNDDGRIRLNGDAPEPSIRTPVPSVGVLRKTTPNHQTVLYNAPYIRTTHPLALAVRQGVDSVE